MSVSTSVSESPRRERRVAILAFQGKTGEFISSGKGRRFTSANATFHVSQNRAGHLEVRIEGEGPLNWWRIELVAPDGRFHRGQFRGAERACFVAPGRAGFSFMGPGRGFNRSFATFTVRDVRFSRDRKALTSLSVAFTQRGEQPTAPPLRGEFIWGRPPRRRTRT